MKFFDIKPPTPPQKKISTVSAKTTKSKHQNSGKKQNIYIYIIFFLIAVFLLSYNNSLSSDYTKDPTGNPNIENLATKVQNETIESPDDEYSDIKESDQDSIDENYTKNLFDDTQENNEATYNTDISITILNGAKKSGLAQELEEKLTNKNYLIKQIGNAVNSYQETTIYANKSLEQFAIKLQKDIEDYASNIVYDTQFSSDTHITIVIGEN